MDQINLQYTTVKTPLPDFIYEGLQTFSKDANLYRPQPIELIEKIAKKYALPKEMILLTAGIDEAIQMFAHAYGSHTYAFTPTYVVIADVELFGKKLIRLNSLTPIHTFEPKIQKYDDATLIYLANPNNPLGYTSKDRVIDLVQKNPHAIVIIDEAYGAYDDLLVDDQVINYPNMAVFRSFSKDYGMAGNRIGYIVSNPEILNKVKAFTTWANVSYLSIGAAITALDHEDYFATIRKDICSRRDTFIQFLQTHQYEVFPSHINAVVLSFATTQTSSAFIDHLKSHNIIVSHGNGNSNIGLDESFVRISIGTKEQMMQVCNVIDTFSKK